MSMCSIERERERERERHTRTHTIVETTHVLLQGRAHLRDLYNCLKHRKQSVAVFVVVVYFIGSVRGP